MRKKSTLLHSLFFISFVPCITFAQLSSNQIDSLVADALVKFKVAGAAVAVVKDGKVIHSKGYGLVDINSKQAVNSIGSPYIIYDNMGRTLLSGIINDETTSIEVSNLSGGIYLFKVGENSIQTFEIIKE